MIALAAGCSYKPGSYADSFGRSFGETRAQLGCLDVAASPIRDARAPGPVVAYAFGNRCDHHVMVDLSTVHAVATYSDGSQRDVVLFDPNHEVTSSRLDALASGREDLAYVDHSSDVMTQLCVDVSRIGAAASPAPAILCVNPVVP